jgi:hypothetical protein
MSVSPGPADLTTIADVSAYLGQDPAQDSDLLQTLVTAVSAFIQSWTGCGFASASYSETRDGTGRDILAFANGPLSAVASLTIDNIAIPASPGWPKAGYSFDQSSLYLTGYRFVQGRRNVQIIYTAGYAATPADVAQACIELVAVHYKLRDKSGLVSEAAMQQTTSYLQSAMPASAQALLNPYRRVFVA